MASVDAPANNLAHAEGKDLFDCTESFSLVLKLEWRRTAYRRMEMSFIQNLVFILTHNGNRKPH